MNVVLHFGSGAIESQSYGNAIEVHWVQDFSSRFLGIQSSRCDSRLGQALQAWWYSGVTPSGTGRKLSKNRFWDLTSPQTRAHRVLNHWKHGSNQHKNGVFTERGYAQLKGKDNYMTLKVRLLPHTACNAETPASAKGSQSYRVRPFAMRESTFSLQCATSSTQKRASKS
jgi:hypothetical protein